MSDGRRTNDDHLSQPGENPLGHRAELVALWGVMRLFLVAAAVAALFGYLLRSQIAAALIAVAVLALVWWWRDVHRPGQEPKL